MNGCGGDWAPALIGAVALFAVAHISWPAFLYWAQWQRRRKDKRVVDNAKRGAR